MQSALSDQAQACADMGNQYPFCSPVSTDVWINGTIHDFIWNFNYPFYVGYETINLYLYYIIKFEYVSVKNYTNLDRDTGAEEVTVDNSWFLSPLPDGSPPQNLTIAGFYLPSGFSPYAEISSPISMFPRPFNFTVTQFAAPAANNNNTNSTNNSTNNNNNNGNNSGNNNVSSASAGASSSNLPGWAIAVIVIAVIAFICGAAALIWTMLISHKNKRSNKLIPITGRNKNNGPDGTSKNRKYNESINSQTKVTAFRSTDSVPSGAENASSIVTLTSRQTYAQPLSPGYENNAILLGRSTSDWNTTTATAATAAIGEEEEEEQEEKEELKRRRLGEALLQRQLEEDGTSVKHAGRFTRVKSLADVQQKSAVFEHPKY